MLNKDSKKNGKIIEGFIRINDFEEHFDIPVDWWTIADYKNNGMKD